MAVLAPIDAIAAMGASSPVASSRPVGFAGGGSFADLITAGLRAVEARTAKADALLQAFAVGDPVPVHEVTLAIEQARMSVEMAMQVRSKLVDTYHDFLNMQL